jgi:hypothetical protein
LLIKAARHPLLSQIPLTVSPFISLPTATTLPYTYSTLPSTLPPSTTNNSTDPATAQFIISPSGSTHSPEEILASCRRLQAHLDEITSNAEAELQKWLDGIKERELAEKRRLAPGWLDREEKILEPTRKYKAENLLDQELADSAAVGRTLSEERQREDDEIERAFGGLGLASDRKSKE